MGENKMEISRSQNGKIEPILNRDKSYLNKKQRKKRKKRRETRKTRKHKEKMGKTIRKSKQEEKWKNRTHL